MKKLVNFRPLVFIFLGLCYGILLLSFCYNENKTSLIISLSLVLLMLIAVIVLLALKNKLEFSIHHAKNMAIILLSIILGFSVCASVVGLKLKNADKVFEQMEAYKFSTVVKAKVSKDCGNDKYIFDDVYFDGQNIGNIKIKITFSFDDDTVLSLGDTVVFSAKLFANLQDNEKLNTSLLFDNIYYYGYCTDDAVEVLSSNPNIFQIINIKTTRNLEKYAGENSGILRALLLGDKSTLDDETYETFKLTGLAHILSVSGLHVGMIALIFVWILKKLKLNSKVQFASLFILLLSYSAICGFSSSVIRASIMSLCLLFSKVIGEQNDSLSGLSLAGIILICLSPLNVLSVGFQLSFLSVGGILLLYRPFFKLLQRIHTPKFLNQTFSITLSATIFTLPIVAKYFGFISPISLLSNLVILPIFSALFVSLFVAFLLSLILPVGVLFYPLSFMFSGITAVVAILSNFKVITLYEIDFLSLCFYYVSLFCISKFLMLKSKTKVISFACSIVLCLVSIFAFRTDFSLPQDKVIMTNCDSAFIVQTKEKQNILVLYKSASEYDIKNICSTLASNKIYSLNQILLPKYDISQNQAITALNDTYSLSNIVLPTDCQESSFLLYSSLKNNGIISYENINEYQISNTLSLDLITVSNVVRAIDIKYQQNYLTKHFVQVIGNLNEYQTGKVLTMLPPTTNYICFEEYSTAIQTMLASEKSFENVFIKDDKYMLPSEKQNLAIISNAKIIAEKVFVFAS